MHESDEDSDVIIVSEMIVAVWGTKDTYINLHRVAEYHLLGSGVSGHLGHEWANDRSHDQLVYISEGYERPIFIDFADRLHGIKIDGRFQHAF